MIDPKLLRTELDAIEKQLKKRHFHLDKERYLQLEVARKALQNATQELQARRNHISKEIGVAKSRGAEVNTLLAQIGNLGEQLSQNEKQLELLQQQLLDFQLHIPNVLDESVPVGVDERDNVEVRRVGEPRAFDFTPKDHVALGECCGGMDFEAATQLSGSRFVVLRKQLAHLQRALTNFMLDVHTQQHGYVETDVPYLVQEHCLFGTGQLPKFRDGQFALAGDSGLTLIPTAEVPLTNLFRETIIDASTLPIKLVAQTACFRSEAGSYGKDTRGMIRLHQFHKVELVQLVEPEKAPQALEALTQHAEKILQLLELPYRVMLLASGDTGFSAAKTYDLEVWLPGQACYREISSCSHFTDFQARRMQARWRNPNTGKPELVHTLNGSGLAVGRALVAVLENYQQANGDIVVPEVLRPYMQGLERITTSDSCFSRT